MTLMKASLKTALLFCLLATPSSSVYAQSSSDDVLSQRADEAINALRNQMKIPGTSVAVVRDGKIIKATGYGLANIELNVPVTPETIFQAGSTGKQFLATAILLLAEEGKLSLDDSITKYFPEAPAWWKPITIRHLLTHTSGLPDVWGETDSRGMFANALVDMRRDYTEDELLRRIHQNAAEL